MRLFIAIAMLVALCGCASAYKPQGFWFNDGFTETKLDTNVFRVNFSGNEFTASGRAEDMVLLRSAEIAIKNDFTHFVIVDSNVKQNYAAFTTPLVATTTASANAAGTVTAQTTTTGGQTFVSVSPSATNTVVYFKSRPNIQALVYDASFLCSSLGKKYEVTCGAN